jgi:hypothetical protein
MKNNTINIDNYELFFVDYLEGNLSSADETMLLAFLEENQFLKEEFNLFLNSKLEPTSVAFNNREGLKKPDFSKNDISNEIDFLCIASIENDITNSEQVNLNSILKGNEENRKTLRLFLKAKLKPNINIKYAHKQSLKRFTILGFSQRVVKIASGVAAGLLLLIGSYSVVTFTQVEQNLQVAITNPVEIPVQVGLPANNEETNHKKSLKNSTFNVTAKNITIIEKVVEPKTVDSTFFNANDEKLSDSTESLIKPIELIELFASSDASNRLAIAEITALAKSDIVSTAEIVTHKRSKKEVGLFEIAQMGVSKFANYTDSDLSLNAQKNNNGKITRISFESSLFAISTPIRKNN